MTREEALRYLQAVSLMLLSADNKPIADLYEALNIAIEVLEQEPKTGHWRAVYQGDEIIDYRCSECEFGNTFGKSTYRMNYCPNCGARMVEPQESEE